MPSDYLSGTRIRRMMEKQGVPKETAEKAVDVRPSLSRKTKKASRQKAWEKKIVEQMEYTGPQQAVDVGKAKEIKREQPSKSISEEKIVKPSKPMVPRRALETKLGQLEQKTEKGATLEELKKKIVVEKPITKEQAIGIIKQKQEDVKSKIEQQTMQYRQALQLSYIMETRNLAQIQHTERYLNRLLSKVREAPHGMQFEVNGKIMSKQEVVDFLESQHQDLLKEAERVKAEYEKYRQSLKRQAFENVYSLKKAEQSYSKYMSQIESLPDVYKFVRKGEEIEVISPTEKYKRDIEKIRKTWGPVGGAVFTAGLTIGKGLVAPTEWVVKTFKLPGWKKMVEKPSRLDYIPLGVEVPFSSEMREYYARHPELVVGGALGEAFGFYVGGKGITAAAKGVKAIGTAASKGLGKVITRFTSRIPVTVAGKTIYPKGYRVSRMVEKITKAKPFSTYISRLKLKRVRIPTTTTTVTRRGIGFKLISEQRLPSVLKVAEYQTPKLGGYAAVLRETFKPGKVMVVSEKAFEKLPSKLTRVVKGPGFIVKDIQKAGGRIIKGKRIAGIITGQPKILGGLTSTQFIRKTIPRIFARPSVYVKPISGLAFAPYIISGAGRLGMGMLDREMVSTTKVKIKPVTIPSISKIQVITPKIASIQPPEVIQVRKSSRRVAVKPVQIETTSQLVTSVETPKVTQAQAQVLVKPKEKTTLAKVVIPKKEVTTPSIKLKPYTTPEKKKKKKKKPLIRVYKPSKTMYAWRRFKLPEFFFGTKSKR